MSARTPANWVGKRGFFVPVLLMGMLLGCVRPLPGPTMQTSSFADGRPGGRVYLDNGSGGANGPWAMENAPASQVEAAPTQVVVALRSKGPAPVWTVPKGSMTTVASLVLDPPAALIQISPDITLAEAMIYLRSHPAVSSATPNYLLTANELPASDDRLIEDQWAWGPSAADVFGAWPILDALPPGQIASTTVAILDTGVDPAHPDLTVLPGYSGFEEVQDGKVSTASFDDGPVSYHGTAVAGIVGAKKDNEVGAAGVLPGVPILPIRVTSPLGGMTLFSLLRGMEVAAYYNRADSPYSNLSNPSAGKVRVVNISVGLPAVARLGVVDTAIEFLWKRGIVVCVAAGNSDPDRFVKAPATSPLAVAVSATAMRLLWEEIAPFSGRGREIWVSAPGEGIWTTSSNDDGDFARAYRSFSGTSAAAAVVSGVAASINAVFGPGDPDQDSATWSERVKGQLARTSDDLGVVGFDPFFGHGRVNARRAISEAPPQ